MQIPGLDESVIQSNTAEGSFERGQRYVQKGAVVDMQQKERKITARVKGSQPAPYTVDVHYDEDGITDVSCTCPFHEGAWCKHIVAALLTILERSEEGEPAVTALLEGLDREALVYLVERLVAQNSDLEEQVRAEAQRLR